MAYLGDFKLGSTIYGYFTTTAADTGAPTQLAGTPAVSVYEDDSNTQITSGVTLGVDADSVTGLNRLTIAATSGNGYEVGKQYTAVITTGTVGGTSAVGYVVAAFSVEKTGLNVSNITYSDGAVAALGIIDSGTAQSATATTLVLRAASGFANDVVNGATIMAFGSTQGYWQSRQVTDYDLATDTVTVDTWTVTPSGTITYILFGTPPAVASGTLPLVNASAAQSAVTSSATAASTANSTNLSSIALRATSANVSGSVSTAQSAALSSATNHSTADSTTLSSVALRATSAQVSTTGSAAASITLSDALLNASRALSAAASAGGIHADAKKMNGVEVTGAGTSANKWRGA